MERQLFTAADIRRLVREQKAAVLVLGAGDLITPEATDVARELGVQIVRAPGQGKASPATLRKLPPLRGVSRAGVLLDVFGDDIPKSAEVRLRDVITAEDGSPLAAGYMALDAQTPAGGVFPWTLTYDEIDIVLEGELIITRDHEQVRGGPGDVIFISKGSVITFGTPSYARFVYVTYPANWGEL
ncbi:cupin domain-containing protein [Caldilinea sp.]|uniref:cupin domain-containing protein n=1 Tax=Caldilinea sp. TaxID=2293560 RepID=UPI002C6B38B3|nr:cupin domain-containing protein [Caldilinea sp.]HRA66106.1 cupin domain-containing protein [Caldilinea sp.]